MLPPLTADASIYRTSMWYVATGSSLLSMPPPVSSAKLCGPTALRYCSQESNNEYSDCNRKYMDCARFCAPNAPSAACAGCVPERLNCINAVKDAYAECVTCPDGTLCQPDISTSVGGGYSYCCPPGVPPCGGTCSWPVCGRHEYFDMDSCECECDYPYLRRNGKCVPIYCPGSTFSCYDDEGNRDCCSIENEQCSSGHCCPTGRTWCVDDCCDGVCDSGHCCNDGEQWWGGQCCKKTQSCLTALSTVDGMVDHTQQNCCSETEHCSPGGIAGSTAGYGNCCPAGQEWCQGTFLGICCDPAKCCDGGCCKANENCSKGHCCPTGHEWAPSEWIGYAQVPAGECCPTTGKPLTWCGSPGSGTFQCCDSDRCCNNICCPAGQQCCNNVCVADFQSNDAHCGNCTTVCNTANGEHCCSGKCVNTSSDSHCGNCTTSCNTAAGQKCCSGQCVNTQTDSQNCGTCGRSVSNFKFLINGVITTINLNCVAGRPVCPQDYVACSTGSKMVCCPADAPVCTGVLVPAVTADGGIITVRDAVLQMHRRQ